MSKPKPTRHAPQEVDAYLAAQEDGFREPLERLRDIIRRVAPECAERVNYKIPIFCLKTDFVAMSAATKHCGFHTMSKAIPGLTKDALKAAVIRTAGTTFHIKTGGELPVELLERVLRARLAEAKAS